MCCPRRLDDRDHRRVQRSQSTGPKREIDERMRQLAGIKQNALGLIELNAELDVEAVAEIFQRINSRGVSLNAADFAMSKMAASEQFEGHVLRKSVDYFCHLAIAPEAYDDLAEDKEFASTEHFRRMEWLKQEREGIYDPNYTDMLRVVFTSEFKRGRLNDLVQLLSGRDFSTRTFREEIAEDAFGKLKEGISNSINETNFKRFVMILRSSGFVDESLIISRNTVNFAYILFLTLRAQGIPSHVIESLVRRWFVMSVLTSRYTNSPETAFGVDIGNIHRMEAAKHLDDIERAELSDAFWEVGLPQQMNTSVASSPYFNVFLASQAKGNDKEFLSRELTVRDLLEGQSNVHHVFPRNYLQKHGLQRGRYNQIANYVLMQSEINIAIGDRPPATYFSGLLDQCNGAVSRFGGITDADQLQENLSAHCIPVGMETTDIESYDDILQQRRVLMAGKIKGYYDGL